uniref:Spo12p n=1 Tax=Rhabditophanes sp. KR3021 TaxID=114890 RepID=A0AC35UGD2_9BILA
MDSTNEINVVITPKSNDTNKRPDTNMSNDNGESKEKMPLPASVVNSPTDSMFSPCTQKLFGNQSRIKKSAASQSHPLNILRMKQRQFPLSNLAKTDEEK